MQNVLKTEQDFNKDYPELSNLLAAYFLVDVDSDIFDINHTINEFCNTKYPEAINKAILQANEILKLDPFPYEVIETSTNLWISQSYDKKTKSEEVKQWLRNVIHLLELRVARKS